MAEDQSSRSTPEAGPSGPSSPSPGDGPPTAGDQPFDEGIFLLDPEGDRVGVPLPVRAEPDRPIEPPRPPEDNPGEGEQGARKDGKKRRGGHAGRTERNLALKRSDVALAMREAKGDKHVAAAALGVRVEKVDAIIGRDPQLTALWGSTDQAALTPDTAERRRQLENPVLDQLAENIRKENIALMNEGLRKAGVSEGVLKKIEAVSALGGPAFIVAALDQSHRLMTVTNLELAEELDYIKTNYLRDDGLEPEVKALWQRAYNEIAKLIGDNYDRNLRGTQVLAQIMAEREKRAAAADPLKNAKPAFAPLVRKA